MTHLTIAIDDDLLERAQRRASELGTSVDGLLREFLEGLTHPADTRRKALDALDAIAERSRAGSGGQRFVREELHDRRSLR